MAKMIWDDGAANRAAELSLLRARVERLEQEVERQRAEYRQACETLAEGLEQLSAQVAACRSPAGERG